MRLPRPSDAEDVALARSDPLTRRYLHHLRGPSTLGDAREYLARAAASWDDGGAHWVVADRESDRLLGIIRVAHASDGNVELGAWFAPWGRGLGACTESTEAATAYFFEHGAARVELVIAEPNVASQRVALRAGFRREGVVRSGSILGEPVHGEPPSAGRCDAVRYSRLPEDEPGPTGRRFPDLPGGALTDGVITLRPTDVSDTDHYLSHWSPPKMRRDSGRAARSGLAAERWCAYGFANQWLAGQAVHMTILTAGGRSGYLSFETVDGCSGEVRLRHSLDPAFQDIGLASRTVRLAARWALKDIGLPRLRSGAAPEDTDSQTVLEQCGFQREGRERAVWAGMEGTRVDSILYALLPGDMKDYEA